MNKNIIETLNQDVFAVIKDAYSWYGIKGLHPNFLEAWYAAKSARLFNLFGDKLIIEKEVEVVEDENILGDKIRRWRNECLVELSPVRASNVRNLCSVPELTTGVLTEDKWLASDLVIKKGSKVSKLIKKLVPADKFDEVMTSYSQVVNTRKIKGKLCLSIHPLDYFTVSHNNCGWDSCQEFYNGDYRSGAGAYLNSDVTVVAYLVPSSGTFEVGGSGVSVNDKKWRAMVSITDDWTLVNRNYPYTSTDLIGKVYEMVEELQGKAFTSETINPYDDESSYSFITGVGYNDTEYNDTSLKFIGSPTPIREARIGTPKIICPKCGSVHSSDSSYICERAKCSSGMDSGVELFLPLNFYTEGVVLNKQVFKVGDMVEIRSIEDMLDEFGGSYNCPNVTGGWNDEMEYLCGKQFEIETIMHYRRGVHQVYGLRDGWTITTDMIKHVTSEED